MRSQCERVKTFAVQSQSDGVAPVAGEARCSGKATLPRSDARPSAVVLAAEFVHSMGSGKGFYACLDFEHVWVYMGRFECKSNPVRDESLTSDLRALPMRLTCG
jgi:hypothetical protein